MPMARWTSHELIPFFEFTICHMTISHLSRPIGESSIMPLALAQSSALTGTLQGLVTDPQGVPLVGAVVRYLAVPASVAAGTSATPRPGENVVNGSVSTAADGSFTLAG